MEFNDPNFENRPYDKLRAYGQSKTVTSLFAVARVVPADDNSSTGVRPYAIDKTAAEAPWRTEREAHQPAVHTLK